jgi:hypothetical protein
MGGGKTRSFGIALRCQTDAASVVVWREDGKPLQGFGEQRVELMGTHRQTARTPLVMSSKRC